MTVLAVDRPYCCLRASYTPALAPRKPSETDPCPDVHGDAEDVVMFMLVHHGGRVGLRFDRRGHPEGPAIIAWIPPEGLAAPLAVRARWMEDRAAQLRQDLGITRE